MHICFPYSMLEPIRDVLYSSMQSDQLSTDRRWITTLRQQLQSAEIELTAELTHATVTLGQIQKMKVGDVIPVAIPDSIIAKVDGTPLMECRFGQQQGQLAIRVERFIAQDKQESTERENHV